MFKLRTILAGLVLLVCGRAEAQFLFFNASSATVAGNSLETGNASTGSKTNIFTASGNVARCTAMAVDGYNSRIFFIDDYSNSLWGMNLNGSGLALVKSGLTNFAMDLSVDVVHQQIYYTTSSTIQSNNTVQRVDYSGNNHTTIFTATATPPDNALSRCTALVLDVMNSKIFVADAGTRRIWSLNSDGSGRVALTPALVAAPLDLTLDVSNRQVYFTVSSTVQSSNRIQRVNYDGSGLITLYTATGGVQRCTALDVDLQHDNIYFSDAMAATIWRVPLAGGAATSVTTGLPATARKVQWYGGPGTQATAGVVTLPPPPGLTGLSLDRTGVISFTGTNATAGIYYTLLTSTNLSLPVKLWTRVSTQMLSDDGNFNLRATNVIAPGAPNQFFILMQ